MIIHMITLVDISYESLFLGLVWFHVFYFWLGGRGRGLVLKPYPGLSEHLPKLNVIKITFMDSSSVFFF